MMKPADLLREILYPFTDLAVLLAMIVFLLLGKLAAAAGLLGLWLAMVLLPAFFRYLLYILESRASNRTVPPLGGELFNWVENFWSLFPLVLIATMVWGGYFLAQHFSLTMVVLFAMILALIFPASMGVLAITRSPVQSLNPGAWIQLIRVCSPNYVLIFPVVAVLAMIPVLFALIGVPRFGIEFAVLYVVFFLFSFTGAVVSASGASAMISIPDAVELTTEEIETRTDADRSRILSHAYGFISRNDRAGGLAHIQSHVDGSVDRAHEYRWFFNEMLKWESKDEALFFAQRYLGYLLDVNAQIDAMKLIARCRLENERFRPLPADRERALDVARRLQHDELVEALSEPGSPST